MEPVRCIEMSLDDAKWGLMQEDGQLKVADISLINLRCVCACEMWCVSVHAHQHTISTHTCTFSGRVLI